MTWYDFVTQPFFAGAGFGVVVSYLGMMVYYLATSVITIVRQWRARQ